MAYIYGTSGPDNLIGYGGADNIYGYGGNDWINGLGGNDWLFGGNGSDTLIGGTGSNDYWGGSGADRIVESSRPVVGYSDDLIHGFTFNVDRIDVSSWGASDFSQIRALLYVDGAGNAAVNAFYSGYDHILRIANVYPRDLVATDFIYSTSGAKHESGTSHADVLFGSGFGDTLRGLSDSDVLLGGRGGDNLWGNTGYDTLIGGQGRDHLWGGKGQDVLIGGGGRDILTGDQGADTFVFNRPADSPVGSNRDHITDFTKSGDLIDVSGIDAKAGVPGNQSFHFIGQAAFSDTQGELRAHTTPAGHTLVAGDVNGDGHADFQILVSGVDHLHSWDFVL